MIATGSEVSVPPVPGLVETGFWTSDEVLDAETLPQKVAVLGGGDESAVLLGSKLMYVVGIQESFM